MATWIWIVIGILIVGGAIALVVVGSKNISSDGGDPLMDRLAEFSERGEMVSLEELELSQPFRERVIVPSLQRVGEISTRFTPQKLLEETTLKIELAGNPMNLEAATFLASRFVVAIFFGGLLFLLTAAAPASGISLDPLIIVPLFTVIGFFFPQTG